MKDDRAAGIARPSAQPCPPAQPRQPDVPVILAEITEDPLDHARYEQIVARRDSGAVVVFHGVVRDHDGGRSVRALEYSAHPMAFRVLNQILTEVSAEGKIHAAVAAHRLGLLTVGETAFTVAVCAAHRLEAFAAAGRIVDEAKDRLPVWKRQLYTDGSDEWLLCP